MSNPSNIIVLLGVWIGFWYVAKADKKRTFNDSCDIDWSGKSSIVILRIEGTVDVSMRTLDS